MLVYLPGVHGDWTLVASLRQALSGKIRFIEITYPRTVRWDLNDYASAVIQALRRKNLGKIWLLAESFGSQPGWRVIQQCERNPAGGLEVNGLILAGGFVRYPARWLLRPLRKALGLLPAPIWRFAFQVYAIYGNFRHRHAPETREAVREFVNRRTPEDIQAILHRIDLIAGSDPAEVARAIRFPVFALSGAVDPIVPWWHTFPAFRKICPGLRARKLVWPADHNVLGTEPVQSARAILEWMGITQNQPGMKEKPAAGVGDKKL